ncbi:hypothetical protein OKW76_13165 [Sphingomonas sp. S1-29]|uniref:hypothetical protein n=1 Tax=Sphingomonas sp. S1-29 TaxID=2991074 RepID=UPI00223FF1B6|nr:hypothetical protein [Sphingomonas sp. S1-29]UZK68966.1 hypothetical protein OKW76_13165 [Sphingomonas sp. S1-29]
MALRIQRHQPRDDRFVGKVSRPAIGIGHRIVDPGVEVVENIHPAAVALVLLGKVERLPPSPAFCADCTGQPAPGRDAR